MSPQQACIHSNVPQAMSLDHDSMNNAILLLVVSRTLSCKVGLVRPVYCPGRSHLLETKHTLCQADLYDGSRQSLCKALAPATGPMKTQRYTSRSPQESQLSRGKDHATCILAFREPQDDELRQFH